MSGIIPVLILIALLVPGIIMSVVPGFPGLLYMFVIVVIFKIAGYGMHISAFDIVILAVITVFAMAIDFFSGAIGAKWGGAHWSSFFSGFAGLLLGSFFIPIPIAGSLLGMFLGILASELYRTRNTAKAGKAAAYSIVGSVLGGVVNILCAILFLGLALYFFLK
jgi:uncharacterized protein YqgC (DUF456 family)